MVQFNKNDNLIFAHGYKYILIFNTNTGQEVKRFEGNNEVFFPDENTFIKTNESNTKYEVFDNATYNIIDSLETSEYNIIAIIVMMHNGFYTCTTAIGCSIYMTAKANHGNLF